MSMNIRGAAGTIGNVDGLAARTGEEAEWRGHRGSKLAVPSSQTTDVIDCETCGFAHVVPLPDPADLEGFYEDDFYDTEKPAYLEKAREDEAWAALFTHDKLDTFAHLLEGASCRLLDIGSGPGMFLKAACESGWQTHGIEPSRQACTHAREMGLEVTQGFFDKETAGTLGSFDVVHMNNMLEHVPNPEEILALAASLVNPGGLLSVTVPNDYNAIQLAATHTQELEPWWVVPTHHLNYFNFESLSRLLVRTGLSEERRLTSFPMEAFLVMGDDYVSEPAAGAEAHARRKAFDLGLEASGHGHQRRAFYQALASTGLGREASIIARKSGKA